MKKLFIIPMVLVAFTLQAQTEKGSIYFTGDANLSFVGSAAEVSDLDVETTVGTFAFKPSFNYFIIDNLSLGLGLEFASSATEVESGGVKTESESATFAIMPQATYFFGSSNTRPYLGLGLGLMSTSTGDEDYEKWSGFALGIDGGVAIFLNDSVALNLGVAFSSANMKNKEDSDFEMDAGGFGLTLGFNVFL